MLVLGRQKGEKILIGDDVVITVVEIRRDGVRIGVQAPSEMAVDRREVREAKEAERGAKNAEEVC